MGDKTGFWRCSHQYTYNIRIILMNVRHVHRNFCFKFDEVCKHLEVLFIQSKTGMIYLETQTYTISVELFLKN